MSGPSSLVECLQALLERTYRLESGVRDIGRFIIGDEGYRAIYGSRRVVTSAGEAGPGGARTLVRETADGVRLRIYYPDRLIRRLEVHPPQHGVTEDNVEPFATLVEELDHFLCIAERAASARPTTLLELELHANVSKHLVLSRFAAGASRRLGEERRAWLRRRLFEDGLDPGLEDALRTRYRDAAALAMSFLGSLEPMAAERRVEALRRFHRLSAAGKVEMISDLRA